MGFCALILLVGRYDAPLVLAVLVGLVGLVAMLVLPEVATLAVMFVLYTNIAPVVTRHHGVPTVLGGSFILLLGIPLIRLLVIRRERPIFDRSFHLMLLLLLVMLLSSLFARDKGIAAERMVTYLIEGVVLYWLVVNVIRRWSTLRRVVWTVLAGASLLGGLSVYQAATGSYEQQFGGLAQRQLKYQAKEDRNQPARMEPEMYRSDRAEGPVGGPNRYAQIMLVVLPLALLYFRTGRSRAIRLCAVAAGLLILAGVVLSYSRGAFVTLVGLLCAMAVVRWIRPVHLMAGGLLLALLVSAFAPAYVNRIGSIGAATSFVDEGSAERADASMRGRLTEMLAALNVFTDHPLLGVGPGQYMPFYSVEYQQDPSIKFRDIRKVRRAHTLYFEFGAETGAMGLGLFLAIVGLLLRDLWRERRRWAEERPELANAATAFWLAILGYLGTGVFLQLSYERYYWFLLALAGAGLHIMRGEDDAERRRATDRARGELRARPSAAISAPAPRRVAP